MTSLQDLISMFNTARRNKYDEDLNKDQTYVTERPCTAVCLSYLDIHNQLTPQSFTDEALKRSHKGSLTNLSPL